MKPPPPPNRIFHEGDRPELFMRPSIFLSAGVPKDKGYRPGTEAHEENQRYLAQQEPARAKGAASQLCRTAFARDVNIIFGAEPAISGAILDVALRFPTAPEPRLIIFQSRWFAGQVPVDTLALADWQAGELLWTEERSNEQESLTEMRRLMVLCPNIAGGVFIGGMDGVKQESALFHALRPSLPCYAVGSTGSAARELLRDDPDRHSGRQSTLSKKLERQPSYPLLFDEIFKDLGVS